MAATGESLSYGRHRRYRSTARTTADGGTEIGDPADRSGRPGIGRIAPSPERRSSRRSAWRSRRSRWFRPGRPKPCSRNFVRETDSAMQMGHGRVDFARRLLTSAFGPEGSKKHLERLPKFRARESSEQHQLQRVDPQMLDSLRKERTSADGWQQILSALESRAGGAGNHVDRPDRMYGRT